MTNTVTVAADPNQGLTNAAIQRAVDEIAADGGGQVIIPPGTHWMHDALHLRTDVRLLGQPGAILKKVPAVSSPIADYLGYGHYEFTVADPDTFRVGMGVHLTDDHAGGFYDTVATITGQDGELFFIDQPLSHDYTPAANARATSIYSLVEGSGVHDAAVEGLVLDGNFPQESARLNGCRGGGVFLLQSQRIEIRDVEVVNYNGDAVSFQQCVDITVDNCRLHQNTGHGLHPGSGSVRYVMRGVQSHHNGRCGVYYCLRTTHSILENCDLHDNGEAGISVGERDTHHLIRGNRIHGNAASGIAFRKPRRRGGDRVVIQANTIGPNCTDRAKGPFEIVIPAGLKEVSIDGNAFAVGDDGQPTGQVIQVGAGCTGVCVVNNTIGRAGSPLGREQIDAAEGDVSLKAPETYPPVGPSALSADGARHLGCG